jgi:hypothetical protein
MIWFVIGAGLGALHGVVLFLRAPHSANYPIQGFLYATVLGTAVYGSILWLLTRLL